MKPPIGDQPRASLAPKVNPGACRLTWVSLALVLLKPCCALQNLGVSTPVQPNRFPLVLPPEPLLYDMEPSSSMSTWCLSLVAMRPVSTEHLAFIPSHGATTLGWMLSSILNRECRIWKDKYNPENGKHGKHGKK